MRRTLAVSLIAPALLIAACGGAATPSPSPAATEAAATTAPTESPSGSSSGAPSSAAGETSVPNALDPCQLVTASEASTLAGATFTAGTEGTTSGGAKTCVYGGQTLNVFQVLVAQASDAATAQAQFTQLETQAQDALKQGAAGGANVSLTTSDVTVSGADKAVFATATGSISGTTISISAIYLLKGPVFVSFSDLVLGTTAPSAAAMQGQAATTLGRV